VADYFVAVLVAFGFEAQLSEIVVDGRHFALLEAGLLNRQPQGFDP
jgi:hypothetical protein